MSATTSAPTPASTATPSRGRATVRGKFFFAGDTKYYIKGVTYGPFFPDDAGCLYHDPETVDRDFRQIAENGINTIRVYTVPPVWLLDAALRHGLRVMVGLPWEQHITFLDDPAIADRIEASVRTAIRSLQRHPAIFCLAIGNEIPASIVRWHGREAIEQFLERLYKAAKQEDPSALVTYVNFPPTEYLRLEFLDFLAFNVYLEKQDRLEAYLARLQNLAGNRPLLMAEVGLDSRRNGFEKQSSILDWQVRSVFGSGAAGVFVFAWTDEWSRGGFEIEDWDFGLTTRAREPKPALATVAKAFADVPFAKDEDWPFFSVVVCSYNGSRTIRETLEHLSRLDYPRYEVIVVNDGSTDATAKIATEFPQFRIISVPNGGLSAARNLGMEAAQGEIVAYIDDDAYPDPHWLHYLGMGFRRSAHVAIGGPNIPPPGDGPIAECVANAPGGPIHVLISDTLAEHIPGCNFVVRRDALKAIGGFDPVYRAAGDDVDCCWRLEQSGGTIGFVPAAVVWHHRRNSLKAYWKQQQGYGKAEALLEKKWPERYNATGHVNWVGRLYGTGVVKPIGGVWRVYQGIWGSAFFQHLYEPSPGLIQSFAQMPEWYFLVGVFLLLTVLGFAWTPLLFAAPLALAAILIPVGQAFVSARQARYPSEPQGGEWVKLYLLTAALFAFQPLARLKGRIQHGLTLWRRDPEIRSQSPAARRETMWNEKNWLSAEEWIDSFFRTGQEVTFVSHGGDYDAWDLQFRGGLAGSVRAHLAVEEHGAGKQLLRWRFDARPSSTLIAAALLLFALAAIAFNDQHAMAAALLTGFALSLAYWTWRDCGLAMGAALDTLSKLKKTHTTN